CARSIFATDASLTKISTAVPAPRGGGFGASRVLASSLPLPQPKSIVSATATIHVRIARERSTLRRRDANAVGQARSRGLADLDPVRGDRARRAAAAARRARPLGGVSAAPHRQLGAARPDVRAPDHGALQH